MVDQKKIPWLGLRLGWAATVLSGGGAAYRFVARSTSPFLSWCPESFELDPREVQIWIILGLAVAAITIPRILYVFAARRPGGHTIGYFLFGQVSAILLFGMSYAHSGVRMISCHDYTVLHCPCYLDPIEAMLSFAGGALVVLAYVPTAGNVQRWRS